MRGSTSSVVIVLGYVVRGPIGGLTWHHVQYVLGLQRLGHEVYFLEDSDDYASCYEPDTHQVTTDPGYGLKYAAAVFERVGLGDRWAYYDAHTGSWHGPCAGNVPAVCAAADIVLNVSGVNPLRGPLADVPVRALVDTDPVFTQLRHLTRPQERERALQHNCFFSFGENIAADHAIPDDGLPWAPTRQPVVIDLWPFEEAPADARFTSILQWESYPAITYDGVHYGMKADSFEDYVELPARVEEPLELALGSATAPRARLRAAGWSLRDPLEVSRTPWAYADYIRGSKAEFGVAKHGYVLAGTGWFSERSTCYLASGRPVVAQDTGFSRWLPTGEGVLAFSDPTEAVTAIESVRSGYSRRCRAARDLVADLFRADVVLDRLLADAMTPSRPSADA